ncbi:MAG: diguanylate cyclase, partial [Candidatus Aquicultorales bacterium]
VNLVDKYYAPLIPNLSPIETPAAIQAGAVKEVYGDVSVVYAGPCFAMKGEALRSRSIDASLTFLELNRLIDEAHGSLSDIPPQQGRPKLGRSYSLIGGLPRSLIAEKSLIDDGIKVVRGLDEFSEIAEALLKGEVSPQFVDALACDGCIDGPGMDSALSVFARKALVAKAIAPSKKIVPFKEIESLVPVVQLTRTYVRDSSDLPQPTEAQIRQVLDAGERLLESDELDCGGCGYSACREMAIAVYQGLASWAMCFPYQKKVFARTVRELKESSATDGLTGLPNHRNFEERLASEFHRARRYGAPLSLVMIDIDFFKEINDAYGHLGGNRFLRAAAKLIKENIRQADFAARYGGDEFVIILPETEDSEAMAVGEKLRRKAEASSIPLGGGTARATLSLGVSSLTSDMKRPTDLIEKADQALYEAKRTGRNKAALAGPG